MPTPRDAETSRRLAGQGRRDTAPELKLRRELHRRGLRYRVDHPIPVARRRADVVFPRQRIAVFVDGCYWHGCPEHGTTPVTNTEWWRKKIETNRERDRDTDRRLDDLGWIPIRVWEHDDPAAAVDRIVDIVAQRSVAADGRP